MSTPIQIVWFKKDLRISDHQPLAMAAEAGPVMPIYGWEPTIMQADDYALQHQLFAQECLAELRADLKSIGLSLTEWPAGIIELLNHVVRHHQIATIWSHEETGNDESYRIDKAVAEWCRVHGVAWHEIPQNGVVRRLKDRNRWNATWEKRMTASPAKLPRQIMAAPLITKPEILIPQAYGIDKPKRQYGGRKQALQLFTSFLNGRATKYRPCMSSPLTAPSSCSRLSPYLAWGTVSMREVVQATRQRIVELKEMGPHAAFGLVSGLTAFESRLHWHCHFIQKMESEPELEFNNLHSAHDCLREHGLSIEAQQLRLHAWINGETGWPLVDACMAMLRETGWLNFRMRAMLMSTASYIYWLHWRQPGLHLAREFLDYEPGIHWPQVQMQSGTTGINALRMYNPIKQAIDQDPKGQFVRYWLPALKHVPDSWIFQPWLMPKEMQLRVGCVIGRDYPQPLVDVETAIREARARLLEVRRNADARLEARAIVQKHGSRKGMPGSVRDQNGREIQKSKQKPKPPQLELF